MIGQLAYPVAPPLPKFTENTPTFNDEGTTTTGWTTTNGTLSQPSSSVVRLTQVTTGSQTRIGRAVTLPVTFGDWNIYAKIRSRAGTLDYAILRIVGTGSIRFLVYFNFDSVTNTGQTGTISVRFTNNVGTTFNAVAATGVDTANDWTDLVFHFDHTFSTLSVHFRQSDGTWKFGAHVYATFAPGDLDLLCNNTAGTASTWVEFDHLTVTAANIVAIGDSITRGATLFSPVATTGLNNGDSTWMRWASIYPGMRNNFIVNKGIGMNTSASVAARIQADALDQLPKLVFLGACNNDYVVGRTLAQRTTSIQSSIDQINAASAKVVLYNAVAKAPGYTGGGGQPGARDYYRTWWREYRGTLTGVSHFRNPMVALTDANGYLSTAYCQPDNIHPNVTGYTRYGKYMAGKKYF